MQDEIIDAPIYPRPFTVTQLDYEMADAAEQFNPSPEERRRSSALGFALSRELSAMREQLDRGLCSSRIEGEV